MKPGAWVDPTDFHPAGGLVFVAADDCIGDGPIPGTVVGVRGCGLVVRLLVRSHVGQGCFWQFETLAGKLPSGLAMERLWSKFSLSRAVRTNALALAETREALEAIARAKAKLEQDLAAAEARLAKWWEPFQREQEAAEVRATERRIKSPDAQKPAAVVEFIRRLCVGVNWDGAWRFHALVKPEDPGLETLALISLPGRKYWSAIGRQGYAGPEYYLVAINGPTLTHNGRGILGTSLLSAATRKTSHTGKHGDAMTEPTGRKWTKRTLAEWLEQAPKLARPL